MGDEVVITYETLFEIFRREKNRGELQKLDANFLRDVIIYLVQKKAMTEKDKGTLFGEEEKMKAEKQLYNVKRILRDLYEKREKKITEMALNKSRTKSALVDDSALLKEERVLFDSLVHIFDQNRQDILMRVINTEMPIVNTEEKIEQKPELKLKFVEDTPEFAGPDMDMLGPYTKDDIASFPRQIAEILLKKGCAEIIQ